MQNKAHSFISPKKEKGFKLSYAAFRTKSTGILGIKILSFLVFLSLYNLLEQYGKSICPILR
jgi:hypothetical protein